MSLPLVMGTVSLVDQLYPCAQLNNEFLIDTGKLSVSVVQGKAIEKKSQKMEDWKDVRKSLKTL